MIKLLEIAKIKAEPQPPRGFAFDIKLVSCECKAVYHHFNTLAV